MPTSSARRARVAMSRQRGVAPPRSPSMAGSIIPTWSGRLRTLSIPTSLCGGSRRRNGGREGAAMASISANLRRPQSEVSL